MNLIQSLKRLSRVAGRWTRRDRVDPVLALYNSGLAVRLPTPASVTDLEVEVADGAGLRALAPRQEPHVVERGGRSFALYPLLPDLFEQPRTLRLRARIGGMTHRRTVAIGPGRVAGRVEGVCDYALTGWASPLSPTAPFEVRLVVDDVLGPPTRPNVFRPDLMFGSAHGGWNGFALPLPASILDGASHRLGVQVGPTRLEFGAWSARPKFHIDEASDTRLTGWFFDASSLDAPTTIRIVEEGRTIYELRTGFRPDLKEAFGREAATFAFAGFDLQAGQTLVAGPEGGGIVLGHLAGEDIVARVGRTRGDARSLLLSAADPVSTLGRRRGLRDKIVEERPRPGTRLHFRPGVDAPEPPAPTRQRPNSPSSLPPICVILPVYKGLSDLRLCLNSLLPQLEPGRSRAILINDGSPEPVITAFLADLAAERRPGLTVIENPTNLGFIRTVNSGFAMLEPGEDACLVNADTILPAGVFPRLARICHAEAGVASVTPMSNNATILSFPGSPEPNAPALGLDVRSLDAAFAAAAASPVEIPTGIGFCMYVNGRALEEVGGFSTDWGRGYCEEVDWCLTARDLGWIHLAATDVFVTHEGSVSFGAAARAEILATNHTRLEGLYPEYVTEVHRFIAADPLALVRCEALSRLLATRFRRLTLHLTHGLGGGTKRYIDDLCALPRPGDHEIGVISPLTNAFGKDRLRLAFDGGRTALDVRPDQLEQALTTLEAAGLDVVLHVDSRLGHATSALDAVASGRWPYVVTLHDFQWYCPKVHLTDERDFYCGEPPPEICQLCVRHRHLERAKHDFADQDALIEANIEAWLAYNERFLRGAQRIVAPSRDTAERYANRLGLSGIVVQPHPETASSPTRPARRPRARTGAVRIAAVGAIGHHKGFDLLVRMAERAGLDGAPIYLRVVGYTPDGERLTRLSNADVTGPYDPGDLKRKLDAFDPDYVFLSSVWPETYSYVLSEVWGAGYPVVAFDFGAPAERIRERGGGVLIPPTRDSAVLIRALLEARDKVADLDIPGPTENEVGTLDEYYGSLEADSATTRAGTHLEVAYR